MSSKICDLTLSHCACVYLVCVLPYMCIWCSFSLWGLLGVIVFDCCRKDFCGSPFSVGSQKGLLYDKPLMSGWFKRTLSALSLSLSLCVCLCAGKRYYVSLKEEIWDMSRLLLWKRVLNLICVPAWKSHWNPQITTRYEREARDEEYVTTMILPKWNKVEIKGHACMQQTDSVTHSHSCKQIQYQHKWACVTGAQKDIKTKTLQLAGAWSRDN